MKRTLSCIGLVLLLLTIGQSALAKPIYERFKETVERELDTEKLEPELSAYLSAFEAKKKNVTVTETDVNKLLQGDASGVCGKFPKDTKESSVIGCTDLTESLDRMRRDEARVRETARLLQAAATSYELPISQLPDRAVKISTDLRAIVNMWSAGTGSMKSSVSGAMLRTQDGNVQAMSGMLMKVGSKLSQLSSEERIAAVWRYQYGFRLVKGDRDPLYPAPPLDTAAVNTERQFLFKRWDTVETAMDELWQYAAGDTFDPPLKNNEYALYSFPKSLMEGAMPDNIILWIRMDKNTEGTPAHPLGDVGLAWGTALEPVMPSLITSGGEPILGGNYPPEPAAESHGLCSDPAMQRGFLCRALLVTAPGDRCPLDSGIDPTKISLTMCTETPPKIGTWCCDKSNRQCSPTATSTACVEGGGSPSATAQGCAANGCIVPPLAPVFCCMKNTNKQCVETITSSTCIVQGGSPSATAEGCVTNGCQDPAVQNARYTIAGPDVCSDVTYREKRGPFDPDTQCTVNMHCETSCGYAEGLTKLKDDKGVIDVCVKKGPRTVVATYLLYHELHHVYQQCNQKPGWSNYDLIDARTDLSNEQKKLLKNQACCRQEGEAYRGQCDLMERDGVFANVPPIDGVTLNAEVCAEVLTDYSCGPRDGYDGCETSRTYPPGFKDKLFEIEQSSNPKNVGKSCEDVNPVTGKPRMFEDARVQTLKDTLERRSDICTPGQTNIYANRIGNNMCYIGQCVEESLELNRLVGGRSPTGVGDSLAPFDSPRTGAPLGNLLINPATAEELLPRYNPALLMHDMETALCQLQGLPPRTPPILCAIEYSQRLRLPIQDQIKQVQSMIGQEEAEQDAVSQLLSLAPALGSRIGTSFYATYLHTASRELSGVLGVAVQLFTQMKSITFPTQMCPLAPGLPIP